MYCLRCLEGCHHRCVAEVAWTVVELCYLYSTLTPHPPRFSCREWAGISDSEFVSLNPLLLCGVLNPVPGVLVCVGDKLSYCGNYYRTVAGDTCATINSLGRVVGLPAAGVTCAAPLPVDTEVCLAPAVNEVRASKARALCCEQPASLLLRLLAHGAMSSLHWQPRHPVKLRFVLSAV